MTQILAYRSIKGVVIGADSRALHYLDDGSVRYATVPKLFRLTPHLLLTTAGAGHGVAACRAFQAHVQAKGLWEFDAIGTQALPFFRAEIERLQRAGLAAANHPELARVYFILAGHDLTGSQSPFEIQLLASERQNEPLHLLAQTGIFSIPRQLALEMKLNRLRQAGAPLARIGRVIKTFLTRLAETSDHVGPPLHLVVIDRSGIRIDRFSPAVHAGHEGDSDPGS